MEILGVRVDNLEKKEILEKVEGFLNSEKFNQIATVNPEFILQAQKDKEFQDVLNSCALNVADGVGIWFAYLRFGKILKYRMTGIDLMLEILKMANEKKLKIFLAVNDRGLSNFEETKIAIKKIYPDLEIKGENLNCHSGLDPESNEILKQVQDDKNNIDIVFANFGAPKQEKFLNSLKNGKIKLAMGVGGSFDYLTGKIKRAPKWMRKIGLEWLWRLILQPKRIKRIFNAVIIFPIKIIFNR